MVFLSEMRKKAAPERRKTGDTTFDIWKGRRRGGQGGKRRQKGGGQDGRKAAGKAAKRGTKSRKKGTKGRASGGTLKSRAFSPDFLMRKNMDSDRLTSCPPWTKYIIECVPENVKYFFEKKQIPKNILAFASESLIYASLNGRTEIVKILVEQEGIDINAKDI